MRNSYIWAVIITVAIAGWLASGDVIVGGRSDTASATSETGGDRGDRTVASGADTEEDELFRVRVQTLRAADRTAVLKVRGRTEADQRVRLRAQTPGLVETLPVTLGDHVRAGDVLCRLETGSREAHVLRARAAVAQVELDHDAASRLSEKGYAAETKVRATKAALDAARATLKEMEVELERTEVRAPFDGVVDSVPAEIGSMLAIGDVCAEIVASDPMLVIAQVSERDVGTLETGMSGTARLVTGDTAEGKLRYIAPTADPATRTFRIELAVSNPDWRLRDGVTAEMEIPLETARAHRFSPAILALDDKGVIGVKTIEEDDRVGFMPVRLLGNEDGVVWVEGLPDPVTVITVGQDYVVEGERVEPVFETADAGSIGDNPR